MEKKHFECFYASVYAIPAGVSYSTVLAKFGGIKMIARKRFCRSNLIIHSCEDFLDNYEEFSKGYSSYALCDVTVTTSGIILKYKNRTDWNRGGRVRCRKTVGLRLELEAPRLDSDKADSYVLEYDEDCILGKILRIWEHTSNGDRQLVMLEDGHFISLTDE